MKKALNALVAAAFVIGLSVVAQSCIKVSIGGNQTVKGDGNPITSEKTVSRFEKIYAGSAAEVRFHESREYRAVVTVDSNLEPYIKVFNDGDTLHITAEQGYNYGFTEFSVDVYCPVLTDVSLRGSASFEGMDKITAPAFKVHISGSGMMPGTVECDNFSGEVSGSGKISVSGISKDADISVSGSGSFEGSGFHIKNAGAHVSGSGKIDIFAEEKLEARASGSGKITYRGEPEKVYVHTSGSGTIKKL